METPRNMREGSRRGKPAPSAGTRVSARAVPQSERSFQDNRKIGGSASGPSRNFHPESCTAVERLQCENLHAFIKKTIFGGRGQGQEGRFRSGETFPVSARAICAIFSGGAARAVVQRLGGRA